MNTDAIHATIGAHEKESVAAEMLAQALRSGRGPVSLERLLEGCPPDRLAQIAIGYALIELRNELGALRADLRQAAQDTQTVIGDQAEAVRELAVALAEATEGATARLTEELGDSLAQLTTEVALATDAIMRPKTPWGRWWRRRQETRRDQQETAVEMSHAVVGGLE